MFQPGEEKLPGGASLMIKEGVLKKPDVHSMIGQHVMPLLPVGTVGFRSGLYMASTDEIYVTVKGKGGHGAMPHLNIDPVLISAHMTSEVVEIKECTFICLYIFIGRCLVRLLSPVKMLCILHLSNHSHASVQPLTCI